MSKQLVGIPLALGYALFTYASFQLPTELWQTLTCSFIFLVPFALGLLTMFVGRKHCRSLLKAALLPWVPCLAFVAILAVIGWEAWICVVLALPVLFFMSSLGGWTTCAFVKLRSDQTGTFVLVGFMLAPFLIAPAELQLPRPEMTRTVNTQIVVDAGEEAVWQNIVRVPAIRPHEQRFALFHTLGLPKPVEATLSHDRAGGMRHARYDNGLQFNERVTEWEPFRKISFTIEVDRETIPEAHLEMIGSEYFDALQGTYVIEPLGDGRVLLHLSSTHRLATGFNFYGHLWSDFLMRDLQNYILRIIKGRVESGFVPA